MGHKERAEPKETPIMFAVITVACFDVRLHRGRVGTLFTISIKEAERIMKKILWTTLSLSLLLSFFVTPLLGQNNLAGEVLQAEERWISAITNQDLAALEEILSQDLIYTHSSGTVEDKSQNITAISSGSLRYDVVKYDAPVIRIYGMTAVVATKAMMSGSNKGQPFNVQLRLLHVWVQEAGKWALVAHQTTRLP